MHAAVEFTLNNFEEVLSWHKISNYVVCLSVPNETELLKYTDKAKVKDIKHQLFREPDYDNAATALCLEAGELSRKLCSNLPLLFKNGQLAQLAERGTLNPEVVGSNPILATSLINPKTIYHEKNVDAQSKSVTCINFTETIKKLINKFKIKNKRYGNNN